MVVYKYKVRSMRKKNARREDKESVRVSWKESKFLPISYVDIQKATDDFSTKNLIGSGGFGTVYKGTVTTDVPEHSTIDIAVKVRNCYFSSFFLVSAEDYILCPIYWY